MRFPFVSRELYDDVVSDLRARLADQTQRADQLEERLYRCFVPAPKVPRPQSTARLQTGAEQGPTAEQRINAALDDNRHTASNPRMRARLRSWADRELSKGGESTEAVDAIVKRLAEWSIVRPDDEQDDDDDTIAVGIG